MDNDRIREKPSIALRGRKKAEKRDPALGQVTL